jgi:hypothetical protein
MSLKTLKQGTIDDLEETIGRTLLKKVQQLEKSVIA